MNLFPSANLKLHESIFLSLCGSPPRSIFSAPDVISEFVLRHNRNRASSNDTQPQPPLNMHAAGTEHSNIKRCAPKNLPWKVASASPLWWADHHLHQRRPSLPHYPLLLYAKGCQCRDQYRQHSVCSRKNKTLLQNWNMTHWQPPQRPLL